ncbi:MAG: hypothetical protein QM489_02610 [Candidatus Izemoplasma sp.]
MTHDIKDYSSLVLETGRKLDYYLIKNLNSNFELEVFNELKMFQNDDGGFGNGLEPDIRLPLSNIASTSIAVCILEKINNIELKETMIKAIVNYYEASFNYQKYEFLMVPKEVNLYPRAVWWNFEDVKSFTFLNPNPEICGFLNQYKSYVTKIDLSKFTKKIVKEIEANLQTASMHSLISVIHFYNRINTNTKLIIKDTIQQKVDSELNINRDNPEEYHLEPYTVFLICNEFVKNIKAELDEDYKVFNLLLESNQLISPKWQWYQYEEVFINVAFKEWESYLTYSVLRFIKLYK